MVRRNEGEYDLIKPEGSNTSARFRYGQPDSHSPTTIRTRVKTRSLSTGPMSRSKSPGAGVSTRKWSPGQASLYRRKKVEGESEVNSSLGALGLHDLNNDGAEEEDYLAKSLKTIEKSDPIDTSYSSAKKRSGRRPHKSKSVTTSSSPWKERPRDLPPSAAVRYPSIHSEDEDAGPRSKSAPRLRSSRPRKSVSTPVGSGSRRPRKNKSLDRSAPPMDQKDLPIEMQERLYRVTDPNNSIKRKVELELEFMQGSPKERKIYLQFRNHFDRQSYFDWKESDDQLKLDNIEANAREESAKEAAFQREVEKKRQEERRLEAEARERERKVMEKARLHACKNIAEDMSTIKNMAVEAATVSVARNQYEKQSYDNARNKKLENFRRNEGKNMTGPQRALREALIEQEDPEEARRFVQGRYKRPF